MPAFTFDTPGVHFEDQGDAFVIRIETRHIEDPALRAEVIRSITTYIENQLQVRFDVAPTAQPRDSQA